MNGDRSKANRQKSTRSRAKPLTWEQAFLDSLRKLGNITLACEAAQIDRSTPYARRDADEKFAAAWDDALEESIDRLEAEARRRAEEGTLKPVFYQGDAVGFIKEYSDTLMVLLLKAHRPEKYRERTDVTSGGEKIQAITTIEVIKDHGDA